MRLFLFMAFAILAGELFGQNDSLHFTLRGSLVNDHQEPVVKTPVYLINQLDTVEITITDFEGKFTFAHKLRQSKEKYIVSTSSKKYFPVSAEIDLRELKFGHDFVLKLTALRILHRKKDNSAYFKKGEWKSFENFEVELLKEVFEEYPQMCVEFITVQFQDESDKLAKKRMQTFKKALEEAGINQRNYILSGKIHYLSEDKESYWNYSPAIQGRVISVEETCK